MVSVRSGDPESSVDDLGAGRSVVHWRASQMMRSVETVSCLEDSSCWMDGCSKKNKISIKAQILIKDFISGVKALVFFLL